MQISASVGRFKGESGLLLSLPRISITKHYQHRFRWNRYNGSNETGRQASVRTSPVLFFMRGMKTAEEISYRHRWRWDRFLFQLLRVGEMLNREGTICFRLLPPVLLLWICCCVDLKSWAGDHSKKYRDRVLPTMFYVKCTQRKNPRGFQNRTLQQNGI